MPLTVLAVFSMFWAWQGCARDLLSRDRDETRDPCVRDRDVQNFVRDEIETFKIRDETLQLPRRWPRPAPETLESLGSFNVSPRRFP